MIAHFVFRSLLFIASLYRRTAAYTESYKLVESDATSASLKKTSCVSSDRDTAMKMEIVKDGQAEVACNCRPVFSELLPRTESPQSHRTSRTTLVLYEERLAHLYWLNSIVVEGTE